jgi:bleomycin hydrolase
MPETHSSSNTNTLNHIFGRLVRSRAANILKVAETNSDNSHLQTLKQNALHEIYRFLVINFGEPPTQFQWRYKKTDAKKSSAKSLLENQTPTALESFTPKSFFDRFVGSTLDDYLCLYNDPKNKLNHHYYFQNATNIAGDKPMDFVNIDMAAMKKIAIASIQAGEPLWFAVNMHFDQSNKHGLMHHDLFDYESLFRLDLSISKADRARFHFAASNHAMTLIGVDLDSNKKPRKWLVENSWGKDKGNNGLWTIHDSWFDEHVYTIITHRKHIPKNILSHFLKKPTPLPAWHPGAQGRPL